MNDLISRKALLKEVNDYIGSHMIGLVTATQITECIIKDIENQPTAYDVDKVVERLEEYRKSDYITYQDVRFVEHKAIDLETVILLVKGGGKDE